MKRKDYERMVPLETISRRGLIKLVAMAKPAVFGHNCWGIFVAGADLCSFALVGDAPRVQKWADTIDAGYAQLFTHQDNALQSRATAFGSSGPSCEGLRCMDCGVGEYLQYLFAWQNTYLKRKAEHNEPLNGLTTFFYLQPLYPTSDSFYTINFSDSGISSHSSLWPSGLIGQVRAQSVEEPG